MSPWLRSGLLTFALSASTARAEETFHLFESTRDLGKGDTTTTGSLNQNSARVQPALLADPKGKTQVRYLQLDVLFGRNTINTVKDISGIKGADPVDTLKKFGDKFGERQYLRTQLFPLNVRVGSWEVAPFVVQDAWLDMRDPVLPQLSFKAEAYSGVTIAHGMEIGKSLTLGVAVHPMYRWYTGTTLAFADVMDYLPPSDAKFSDKAPLYSAGFVPVDLSAQWHPFASFAVGMKVAQVGDSAALQNYGTEPPTIPQSISLGISQRIMLGVWDLDLALEGHDLAGRMVSSGARKVHAGAEFGRKIWTNDHDVGVTAGYNDGYACGGAFVDIYFARLEYSNYAVELGRNAGQRPDRRHALSLMLATTF